MDNLKRAVYMKEYFQRPEVKARARERQKARYHANPKKFHEHNKKWKSKNQEVWDKILYTSVLKTRYGLTYEQYEALYNSQNGACFVCKIPEGSKRLCVDHDHKTGMVRKLLCDRCNRALSYIENHSDVIQPLQEYLAQHAQLL